MNHTQYLQQLINDRGYKSYLEIGYGKGHNFEAIEVSKKTAVDPYICDPSVFSGTSDEYFEQLDGRTKFDVIFIDGDHTAEQAERDIVNAWKHLKKDGTLVLHDVWPTNEEMQVVPRLQKEWTGNVWRAWHGLLDTYPRLVAEMITDDYGIGSVAFNKDIDVQPGFVNQDISFEEYHNQGPDEE